MSPDCGELLKTAKATVAAERNDAVEMGVHICILYFYMGTAPG